jgi:hypothetical protein
MAQRLYIYYQPGVNSDPTTGQPIAGVDWNGNPVAGPNQWGVYWTGVYDPATGCSTTPLGFPDFERMATYAQAHGETLVPFQNAQQVIAFCQRVSGASWPSRSPAPVTGQPAGGSLLGGLSTSTLLLLAAGAYFLLGRKKSAS